MIKEIITTTLVVEKVKGTDQILSSTANSTCTTVTVDDLLPPEVADAPEIVGHSENGQEYHTPVMPLRGTSMKIEINEFVGGEWNGWHDLRGQNGSQVDPDELYFDGTGAVVRKLRVVVSNAVGSTAGQEVLVEDTEGGGGGPIDPGPIWTPGTVTVSQTSNPKSPAFSFDAPQPDSGRVGVLKINIERSNGDGVAAYEGTSVDLSTLGVELDPGSYRVRGINEVDDGHAEGANTDFEIVVP